MLTGVKCIDCSTLRLLAALRLRPRPPPPTPCYVSWWGNLGNMAVQRCRFEKIPFGWDLLVHSLWQSVWQLLFFGVTAPHFRFLSPCSMPPKCQARCSAPYPWPSTTDSALSAPTAVYPISQVTASALQPLVERFGRLEFPQSSTPLAVPPSSGLDGGLPSSVPSAVVANAPALSMSSAPPALPNSSVSWRFSSRVLTKLSVGTAVCVGRAMPASRPQQCCFVVRLTSSPRLDHQRWVHWIWHFIGRYAMKKCGMLFLQSCSLFPKRQIDETRMWERDDAADTLSPGALSSPSSPSVESQATAVAKVKDVVYATATVPNLTNVTIECYYSASFVRQ